MGNPVDRVNTTPINTPMKKNRKKYEHQAPDMADGFRAMTEHRKEQNAQNLKQNTGELLDACEFLKLTPLKLTEYHYRITHGEMKMDIYVMSRRYHNLKTQKRGMIRGTIDAFLIIALNIDMSSYTIP